MKLRATILALALLSGTAHADTLRRAALTADGWQFIATHQSAANGQAFVTDTVMGPYPTQDACLAINTALQPVAPPSGTDFTPWNGTFKTTCCFDTTTGASACPN